jgi:ribonuclease D
VEGLAIDTEADSLHHYYNKVCLIQLAFDGENVIVDPLANVDLTGFLEIVSRKGLILHGADFDLRMLRNTYGFRPRGPVFDTAIAAQLLGISRYGLSALVKRYFGVTLSKHGQKSNWARRPLSPDQLEYASNDTRYLVPLAEKLDEELLALGRKAWHEEACARMVVVTGKDAVKEPDREWRIKGLKGLSRRQLAFVREVWRWRESEAKRADLPPFKIVGEKHILEIALWAEAHGRRPFAAIPGLPRNCSGRRLDSLRRALAKARGMPSAQWPDHLASVAKKFSRPTRSKELRHECERLARKLNVEPAVIASRATLESIARAKPSSIEGIMRSGPTMRWQAELLKPCIDKLFHGEGR